MHHGFPSPDFDPDFAGPAEWAAMYRACGLQVVPAKMPIKGGQWKMPALASWTEFQENLIPQATFDRWYGPGGEHASRQNMGIITGRASGNVFVIDLDDQKGPEPQAWWHALLETENSGIEPETIEQRTGGGGRQKLFRAPTGYHVPTNRTSIGVDVRGQAGFAMMPASQHESGEDYKWVPGRAPWEIEISVAEQWLLDAVEALVGAYGGDQGGGPHKRTASLGSDYDAFGNKQDDRERTMRDVVWHGVLEWYRECPIRPPEREWEARAETCYEIYERKVTTRVAGVDKREGLKREKRGPVAFWKKWRATMRHWGSPRMISDAAKPPPKDDGAGHDYSDEFAKAKATVQVLEYLDVRQIKAQPDPVWMIDELINERALGFIFGPPGSLKTFLALDIALSTTARLASWWGRSINQSGAVIYLCREGVASLKFRIMAWEQHRQTVADDAPFYLIRKNINFMKPEDVGLLLATVDEIAVKVGPIAAVFVDTVSRVLPGAKENQQEDMTLFVDACEALQQRFNCVVVGVHHVNRQGSIRGSSVIPGAGDFLIETRREPGAMTGSIVLQKVKDGEDGTEFPFKVTKIDLGGIVPRSSLMVDPSEEGGATVAQMAGKDGLPDMAVCREILAAIATAWFRGAPMSMDNSARPAVQMIMARWFLKRDAVKRLLAGWMVNNIIEHTDFPGKKKVKGYRKLIDV